MSKKIYDEASAIRAVSKKCAINYGIHQIEVPTEGNNVPGNATWGKIDYLCNYCGWHWVRKNVSANAKTIEKKQKQSNNKHKKNATVQTKHQTRS